MKKILLFLLMTHVCWVSFGQDNITKILEIPWDVEGGCKTELRPEGNFGLSDYEIINDTELAVLCDVERKMKIYNFESKKIDYEFSIKNNPKLFTFSEERNAFYVLGRGYVYEYSRKGDLVNTIVLSRKIKFPVALKSIGLDLFIITSYQESFKLIDNVNILSPDQQFVNRSNGQIIGDGEILNAELNQNEFLIRISNKEGTNNYRFNEGKYDNPGIKIIGQDKNCIYIKMAYFTQINPIKVDEELLVYSKTKNMIIERILIPKIFHVITLNEFKFFNGCIYHLISTPDAACFYRIDLVRNGEFKNEIKYPDDLNYEHHYNIDLKKKNGRYIDKGFGMSKVVEEPRAAVPIMRSQMLYVANKYLNIEYNVTVGNFAGGVVLDNTDIGVWVESIGDEYPAGNYWVRTPNLSTTVVNTGMAYKWCGWTHYNEFHALIAGRYVGDISTLWPWQGGDANVIGLDCSGLVTRAWHLNDKHNCSDNEGYGLLHADVTNIINGFDDLRRGDIIIDEDDHVRLVMDNNSGTTVNVIEAIFTNVSENTYNTNVLANYVPRRYVDVTNYDLQITNYTELTTPILKGGEMRVRFDVQNLEANAYTGNFRARVYENYADPNTDILGTFLFEVGAAQQFTVNGNATQAMEFSIDNIPATVNEGTYRITLEYNRTGNSWPIVPYDNYAQDSEIEILDLPPVANFSADLTYITEGDIVYFTDYSTNNPTSWTWLFEGGTPPVSTEQNPSVVYNEAGMYQVGLTVSNFSGTDQEIKSGYIIVIPLLEAKFIGNPTAGDEPLVVEFEDQSIGDGITSWGWEFPGGTPSASTVQHPTVTYNTIGTYSVSLTVTDASGSNTETKTDYIYVDPYTPPTANFYANNTSITPGQTVNFTNNSPNSPTSWLWTFSGGNPSTSTAQNPSVTYNTNGIYDVSLTVSNSDGNDIVTKTGYINVHNSGVTVSGKIKNQVNELLPDREIRVSVNANPSFSIYTDSQGNFVTILPYGCNVDFYVVGKGYSPFMWRYSYLTEDKLNLSICLWLQSYDISIIKQEGTWYKISAFGGLADSYIFDFGDGDVIETYMPSQDHWFACDKNNETSYTVKLTYISYGEELVVEKTFDVPSCPDVLAEVEYANNCRVIGENKNAVVIDKSEPLDAIWKLEIDWGDGAKKTWLVNDNNDPSNPGYSKYAGNCRKFLHQYDYSGKRREVKIKAYDFVGNNYSTDVLYFDIVNCYTQISNSNISDKLFNYDNGLYSYRGGSFELTSLNMVSDYNNSSFSFVACKDIVLKPGFSAKPSSGKTTTFEIGECLQDEIRKSEILIEDKPPWAFEDVKYVKNCPYADIVLDEPEIVYDHNTDIEIYPNPTEGEFVMELTNDYYDILLIEVYNTLGVKFIRINDINQDLYEFDLSKYSKGIYFVKVLYSNKQEVYKVIYR